MRDFEFRLEKAVELDGEYRLSLSEVRFVLGLIGELDIVTAKCFALERYFKSKGVQVPNDPEDIYNLITD